MTPDGSFYLSGTASESSTNSQTADSAAELYHVNADGTLPPGQRPNYLPTTILAANFDQGGEGVAYHDTDAANLGGQYRPNEGVDIEAGGSGYAVDYTRAGEWLQYSVTVTSQRTSQPTFSAMVSNASAGGAFHVEVDGQDVTGEIAVPDTGSWQNYVQVSKATTPLTTANT